MKKMIDELWDGEISPQDTLISDNQEYRELQHRQSQNKAELLEALACASDEGAVSDMLRFDPDLVRGELTKEQIEHYVIPRIKDKLGGMGKLSEDGDSRSEIFLAQKDRCYKISKEFCCIEIERDEDTCHIEDIVTSFCTERTDLEIIERIRQAYKLCEKIHHSVMLPINVLDTNSQKMKTIS